MRKARRTRASRLYSRDHSLDDCDLDNEVRKLATVLVTQPEGMEALARICHWLSHYGPASPYQDLTDALEDQALELRFNWEQVGGYLHQAMEEWEPTEESMSTR